MKKFRRSLLASALVFVWALPAFAGPQPGVNSNFAPVWSIPIDSIKWTYSLSMANLVAASSATTVWQLCGSATQTIRVTKVTIAGRATAAASADMSLIKTSTAATGGTIASGAPFSSAAVTGVPYDSSFPTGTALSTAWTANPTVGTPIGTIGSYQLALGNLTTAAGSQLTINFGDRASAPVLRGAAQCLAINFAVGSAPGSGNLLDITMEWTEE